MAEQAVRRAHSERLAAWLADFPSFAALLEIIPREGPRLKLRPNAIQTAFDVARSGRDIILKPRQVGLTTWELARDVWFFLTHAGANVVVVCQSMAGDGAIKEISNKVRIMLDALQTEGIALAFSTETSTHWVLKDTDSSLKVIGAGASESSASKKGRAGTIHRLHITELALFEHAGETLNAILECVPGPQYGTEIVIESTAKGAHGSFFERYKGAKAKQGGYSAHFFPWFEQREYRAELEPGESVEPETVRERELVAKHAVTPEQLKWYRQKVVDKTQDLVDQEYPSDEDTCWLIAGRLFFNKDVTEKLRAEATAPIEVTQERGGTFSVWELPKPGATYVIAVDPSEGIGGDPGALIVYERETGKHVATLHGQFPPWELASVSVKIAKQYNMARLVVERNNHGHAVLQAIDREAKYPRVYKAPDGRPGWYSTEVSRSTALDAFEDAHRRGTWKSNDAALLGELRTFVVDKTGKAAAAPGAHDDLTMAAVIGWDVIRKPGNALVAALKGMR